MPRKPKTITVTSLGKPNHAAIDALARLILQREGLSKVKRDTKPSPDRK